MHSALLASALFSAIPLVAGHGHVLSPPARAPGDAMKAVCGQQIFSTVSSDVNGNVQQEVQVSQNQKDFDPTQCNLALCKGYQFADNMANVQAVTAGQVIPWMVTIEAPHTGVMNVSVLDTATNTLVGDPLIVENDYASTAHTIPANNTAFSVTVPDTQGKCAVAGACVMQWWWNAPDVKQTYEGCVDFTEGAAGTAAPAAAAPSNATTRKERTKRGSYVHRVY